MRCSIPQYASPRPLNKSLPVSSAAATNITGPSKCCATSVSGVSRAEIAQVHYQSVYAVLLKLFQSARSVVLVFHGGLDLDYFAARLAERLNYGVTAALAQVNREAVAADGYYAKLYLRYVHHAIIPPFHGGECRAD